MLQNAYFVAKIGADTAENERKFAENLPMRAKKKEKKLATTLRVVFGGGAGARRPQRGHGPRGGHPGDAPHGPRGGAPRAHRGHPPKIYVRFHRTKVIYS